MRQKGIVIIPVIFVLVLAIGLGGVIYLRNQNRTVSSDIDNAVYVATESGSPEITNEISVPSPKPQETTPPFRNITVSGFTYEDRSDDRIYNSDDPKLPNMQLYMLDSYSNQVIHTVFTDSSGEFSISLQVRGNMIIRASAYNNFIPKTPEKVISSSASNLEFRFRSTGASVANQTIGIIEGNVYHDANRNKLRDGGENSVYFYKLYLKDSIGNYFNTVDNAQTTDPGGHFKYVDLPVPGNYTLVLSNPTGAYDILQPEKNLSLTHTSFQNTNVEIPVYKY